VTPFDLSRQMEDEIKWLHRLIRGLILKIREQIFDRLLPGLIDFRGLHVSSRLIEVFALEIAHE